MFSLGNTSYNSYIANSVNGQITNMIGGIAAAIYDGNYQMGAYGASQVFQYNDSAGLKKKQNPDGPWSVYDLSNENDPYLVATSDRPDLSGKLTFVYSRFTAPDGSVYTRYIADAAIKPSGQSFENAATFGGALAIAGGVGAGSQKPVTLRQHGPQKLKRSHRKSAI